MCSVNLQGRSLLSLSLSYLDDSIEVTRTLINLGARVWPLEPLCGPGPGASVPEITRDTESSAFTWLLRAVVSQRGLENTEASLECVAHVMAAQPERMKSHVIRVMLRSVTRTVLLVKHYICLIATKRAPPK